MFVINRPLIFWYSVLFSFLVLQFKDSNHAQSFSTCRLIICSTRSVTLFKRNVINKSISVLSAGTAVICQAVLVQQNTFSQPRSHDLGSLFLFPSLRLCLCLSFAFCSVALGQLQFRFKTNYKMKLNLSVVESESSCVDFDLYYEGAIRSGLSQGTIPVSHNYKLYLNVHNILNVNRKDQWFNS